MSSNGKGAPALELDAALEMRIRVANRVEAVLREEAEGAGMSMVEAMHILGIVLGIGMAGAPGAAELAAGAAAHRDGVAEGMRIRQAVSATASEVDA